MDPKINSPALITKEIIYPGSKYIPLTDGSRVKFHYQTIKCDDNKTIIDDSRKTDKPMELVLGKKFKLEVWETIVYKMSLNEVSKFTVDKSLVSQYPFISKAIRDSMKPPESRKHCCGMTIQNEGMGYKDLDELFNKPCNLQFIIELTSIELPNQYERDVWQLNDDEKLISINEHKEKGNNCYKEKNYADAEENYRIALTMVEQLLMKFYPCCHWEKPHDEDWLNLIKLKTPILSNFAQCRLLAKDYYSVIEHCTDVIKHDPDNVKAYYRRAKAHVGAWNPEEAKCDFEHCIKLDKTLTATITKELSTLTELIRVHDAESKFSYQKLFDT